MKNGMIIISLILFAGCSAKFTMTSYAPPDAENIALKTVSVIPFDGDENSYFSDTLASVLAKLEKDGEPAFTLVPEGGEGVFSGEIRYEYHSQELEAEQDTKSLFGLEPEAEICVEHNYDLAVNIHLMDAESGETPYTRDYERRMSVLTCPGGRTITLPGRVENLEIGREISPATADLNAINPPYVVLSNSILDAIAKDLGSYMIITKLKLAKPDKALNKEERDVFKTALHYMKKDDYKTACALWKNLYDENGAKMPGLNFNLGVCFELAGNYDEALTMYRQASEEKRSAEAMSRVEIKKERRIEKKH